MPLQDEIEFGYIEAPHKGFPVVLDSPRDGNLKEFPVKQLLVRCRGPPWGGGGRDAILGTLPGQRGLETLGALNKLLCGPGPLSSHLRNGSVGIVISKDFSGSDN